MQQRRSVEPGMGKANKCFLRVNKGEKKKMDLDAQFFRNKIFLFRSKSEILEKFETAGRK